MNLTDFTYAVGEICLYYALIGSVFQLFGCSGTFLPQAILLLAGEVLCAAVSRRKKPFRYLPLVLILPALWIGRTIGHALLGAPAAIVLILRAKAGSFRADHDTLRSLFLHSFWFYALVLLTALVAGKASFILQASLPCYTIWLLCAVLCMRQLRIPEQETDLKFRLLNFALLMLILLAGFILSSDPVTSATIAVLRTVYLHFIAPLLFIAMCVIAAIPAAIFYVIFKLISLLKAQDTTETEQQAAAEIQQALQEAGADALVTPEWLIRCAAAVGILLFLLVAWLLARKLVNSGRTGFSSGSYMRREAVSDRSALGRHKSLFSSSAEDGIRACYRKFLRLCHNSNIPTDGSLASDAVLQKASFCAGAEDASELRRLWLPVRYGAVSASPENLKKAQAALAAIQAEAAQQEKARRKQRK